MRHFLIYLREIPDKMGLRQEQICKVLQSNSHAWQLMEKNENIFFSIYFMKKENMKYTNIRKNHNLVYGIVMFNCIVTG